MDLTSFKLKKTRIYTPDQAAADELWNYFGKKLPFARIMRIIKIVGRQKVFKIVSEIKQSDCRDSLSLFIYRTSKRGLTQKS